MIGGSRIESALDKTLHSGEFLHAQIAQASPDLMRGPLATFVDALLGAALRTGRSSPVP